MIQLGANAFAAGDLRSAVAALRNGYAWSGDPAAGIRLVAAEIRLGLLAAAEARAAALLDADATGYASLQLGNGARYRGRRELAQTRFEAARARAEARKDAALAVAADCGMGELMLDLGEPRRAVRFFGRALGLTEMTPDDAVTVAPLAGLAQAHAAWRAPAKAERLAIRALDRADAAGDASGKARVLLALATAFGRADDVEAASAAALAAPHVPLWVRTQTLRAVEGGHAAHDEPALHAAHRVATWAGMEPEIRVLEGAP
jgi:tetratricopeptide (TPR) repeat protein